MWCDESQPAWHRALFHFIEHCALFLLCAGLVTACLVAVGALYLLAGLTEWLALFMPRVAAAAVVVMAGMIAASVTRACMSSQKTKE